MDNVNISPSGTGPMQFDVVISHIELKAAWLPKFV